MFFRIVPHIAEYFSTLCLTVRNIFPLCGIQCGLVFRDKQHKVDIYLNIESSTLFNDRKNSLFKGTVYLVFLLCNDKNMLLKLHAVFSRIFLCLASFSTIGILNHTMQCAVKIIIDFFLIVFLAYTCGQ